CQPFVEWLTSSLRRFLGGNHVDIDVATVVYKPAQRIPFPEEQPARAEWLAGFNLCNVVFLCYTQQRLSYICASRGDDLGADLRGKREMASQADLFCMRQWLRFFDVGHDPRRLHGCRQPPCISNQTL